MLNTTGKKELEKKIELLEIQVKHLENDLSLTRNEYKEATQNYFDLYFNIEEKVKERSRELRNVQENLEAKTIELEQERAELRKTRIELKKANQVRSEFLANISHELKTPLNSILGFSELLNKATKTNTEKEYSEAIISSGEELLLLINDMVDISKIEAGKRKLHIERINIVSILKEIENMYRLKAEEKGIQFEMNISPNLPQTMMIDGLGMRQILTNLVGNAVKFTELGSVNVSIKCKEVLKQNDRINIYINVKDTGIGIEENKLEDIFNMFEQKRNKNSRQFSGTGLGLTITKRLVEMMGGKISVSSKLKKGSTFTVHIPNIKADYSDPIISSQFPVAKLNKKKQTILIVDDDAVTITMLKIFLKKTGCAIIETDNGKDAIKKALKFKPEIIITDVRLPEVGGIETIKKLREKKDFKDTIFITVSGDNDSQTMKNAKEAGSNEYITKPIRKKKLDAILYKYLNIPIDESEKTEDKKLSKLQISKMKILAKELEEEYKKEWERLSGSMILNEIENFANKLLLISTKYNLDDLEKWSKQTKQYAASFRIDLLNKVLTKFPEVSKVTIKKIAQYDTKI